MVEAYFAALLAARRYSSLYGAVSSSWVFSLGFVMAGRSFLPVGMEKRAVDFLGCPLGIRYK